MKDKQIILYILNPIWVFYAAKEFMFDKVSYFSLEIILMILAIIGYSVFSYFNSNKWNKTAYHILFLLLNSLIFITFPLGIVFALIAGLSFAVKILLFFYFPPLVLAIFNVKQLIQIRKK